MFDQIAGSEEYDYTYVFEAGSSLTFDGSCVFEGNRAIGSPSTGIINIAPLQVRIAEPWDGQTHVYDGNSEVPQNPQQPPNAGNTTSR